MVAGTACEVTGVMWKLHHFSERFLPAKAHTCTIVSVGSWETNGSSQNITETMASTVLCLVLIPGDDEILT